MNYVNPPADTPQHVFHKMFFSQVLHHEIGYNIYLPPDYQDSSGTFPVVYHIHGWMGNESAEIWPLERAFRNRRALTVFVNAISSEAEYCAALLQIGSILVNELIPHIDEQFRTETSRENRMLSGFSMGGNMAFYYAVKHHELFGSVCAYAGTFHHLFFKEYRTVGVAPEKANELYEDMVREKWYLEENNILYLVRERAGIIRERLRIAIHIGTADIVFCDSEIMHRYLNSLSIPHEYKVFDKTGHDLEAYSSTCTGRGSLVFG